MQEQGLILETFKKSNTKIITPRKVYDLHNEFDEEYSEFEAFMARKELKIINRRLQSGRIRSIEDGNYISPLPPYGYEILYTNEYRTLKPHPDQAEVVKIIFDLYTNHKIGCNKVANKLNELGYKTYTNKKWSASSVLTIIKNPIYIGKVTWKKKEIKKSSSPDKMKDTRQRPKSEWIIADGKHEPIIAINMFEKAQEILKKKYHIPYHLEKRVANPLAGLIRCKYCGASMILRPYKTKDSRIMCYANCGNKSSKLKYIEQGVINGLNKWLMRYKAQWSIRKLSKKNINTSISIQKKTLEHLKKELLELENQQGRLHDFLERGIYDETIYLKRLQSLTVRVEDNRNCIEKVNMLLEQEIKKGKKQQHLIPKFEKVLDVYSRTNDPIKKNMLLKSILNYAIYHKEKNQRNDNFTLILYPKLPH